MTLHVDFMSFVTIRLQTRYWVSAAKIYTKEASELDVVLDKGQNKVDSGTEIRDGGYPLLSSLILFTNIVCGSYLIEICLFLGF